MSLKKQIFLLSSIVFVLFILLLLVLYQQKIVPQAIKRSITDEDKVCISKYEYNKLLASKQQPMQQTARTSSQERDIKVLRDPLYPPLNRSETDVFNSTIHAIDKKQLYNKTQEFTDQYRMVAYVTNPDEKKDSGGNVWKLIARQSNRNKADFYLIPANNNYDMKIMLSNDIVVGNEKLRDIYTIPKTLSFKSPLLNETPYEVTELEMTDMTNFY